MLCLMLERGFSHLRGLCRHKQFSREEKHRCEKTEPVALKKKRVSMKSAFSWTHDEV